MSFEVISNNCLWFNFKTQEDMSAFNPNAFLLGQLLKTSVTKFKVMREKPFIEFVIHGKRAEDMDSPDISLFASLNIPEESYRLSKRSGRIRVGFESTKDAWKVIEKYEKNPDAFVWNFCSATAKAIDIRAFPVYCAICSAPGHMKEALKEKRCRTCILENKSGGAVRHEVWSGDCHARARMEMLDKCERYARLIPYWVTAERKAAEKIGQLSTDNPSGHGSDAIPATDANHPGSPMSPTQQQMSSYIDIDIDVDDFDSPSENGLVNSGDGNDDTTIPIDSLNLSCVDENIPEEIETCATPEDPPAYGT
ncbi:hypothetical protein LX32DRAFT_691474 [Colletotrichum zoysiae]|uniref:Uncharacterized protein n=1 Tax=Colletotrichum zoysiae TaxID=1216348 RepID=A0AAD9M4H4_9PEZI|nr:hypothetical protein LX32DRAFT_691474 [Colletotrichum zoysiae]